MGRDNREPIIERMGKEEEVGSIDGNNDNDGKTAMTTTSELAHIPSEYLFIIDTSPQPNPYIESYFNGIYARNSHAVIGEDLQSLPSQSSESLTARCFNCGNPEHILSVCPFRHDRALVALSRQYYDFYRDLRNETGAGNSDFSSRFYIVEQWKQTRLSWLGRFVPGEIRSDDLREALGMPTVSPYKWEEAEAQARGQDSWLRNMTLWGYPPGWTSRSGSEYNPFESMRTRISYQCAEIEGCDAELLHLYHGDGHPEIVELAPRTADDTDDETLRSDELRDVSTSPRRWAEYPATYFLHSLLPVYTGVTLPPVGGAPSPPASPPPPPPDSPPPLPQPLPPSDVPSSTSRPRYRLPTEEEAESDMDLSDDE